MDLKAMMCEGKEKMILGKHYVTEPVTDITNKNGYGLSRFPK